MDWTQEECEALGGYWRIHQGFVMCTLPHSLGPAEFNIVQHTESYCIVEVTNLSEEYAIAFSCYVEYLALTPENRYIKLRSINEESIQKYGRRTMDLPWQMGMHPTIQQGIIDGYCARYSEPVSMVSMTVEGKDDDMIEKILNLKIDDKHEFIHFGLDMIEQFFINNLDVHHDINGLLEGVYDLEQVRDMERTTFFTLDSSLLNSEDVLAW
jgi:hypothetical protein